MDNLFLCDVELRSLADFEKFKSITDGHVTCENVKELDEEKFLEEISVARYVFVKVVVNRNELAELKRWFCVVTAKEAASVNGLLYTLYKH